MKQPQEKLPILLHDVSHVKMSNLEYHSEKEMVKITGKSDNIEFDKSIPEEKNNGELNK